MRRVHQFRQTERALTLALLLAATGYAPEAIPFRDLVPPGPASTGTSVASLHLDRETTRSDASRRIEPSGDRRFAPDHVARHAPEPLLSPTGSRRDLVAPAALPYRALFLAPPSGRGPPLQG